MTSASPNIPTDDDDDFLAFCVQRNKILPAGVYVVRVVPKTARLLGKDNVFDLGEVTPDKVRGVEFRFDVVDATDKSQIGRQFRYGFAVDGPTTVSAIVAQDLDAIASWLQAVAAEKVPGGRLDLLAKALNDASEGKLLKARISHRSGPRIRIERIAVAEASK
jgi:hypothetical protein